MSETRINHFRVAKGLSYTQLGVHLGVKPQQGRRYCLPPTHDDHRRPGSGPSAKLIEISGGLVHPGNYADVISKQQASEMMADVQAALEVSS